MDTIQQKHENCKKLMLENLLKRTEKDYNKLQKIIFDFKNFDDLINYAMPYINEGFCGVAILYSPFVIIDEKYKNLQDHISKISNNLFKLSLYSSSGHILYFEPGDEITVNKYKIHFGQDFKDEQILKNIENRLIEIENKITEIYHSPGMPGFVKAKKEFENFNKLF